MVPVVTNFIVYVSGVDLENAIGYVEYILTELPPTGENGLILPGFDRVAFF